MQFLFYSENLLADLLTICAIIAAVVLVFCLIAMTISMCKNDKVKRDVYRKMIDKANKKNTDITMEL